MTWFAAWRLAMLLSLGGALLLPAASLASERPGGAARLGTLQISGAWIRAVPPAVHVVAGYLEIRNDGDRADRLTAVVAPFACRIGFHRMSVTGGAMRLSKIEGGLVIAPGGRVVFEPGANQVLFKGISAAPRPGETVPVVFRFENAGEVEVRLPVSAIGAAALEE